jgi:TetR/AcrR family transcriptional regulator, transcriptional repressor for nem operon
MPSRKGTDTRTVAPSASTVTSAQDVQRVEADDFSTHRQEQARRTRESLITTGLAIAERVGLSGMSVNRIVEEAGVAKGTFFHHFPDRSAFLVALHREFHERLLTKIGASVSGVAPGRDRLLRAANAYLDACLRDRGVRALLLEARADPQIAQEIAVRNERTAQEMARDFAAMGWAHSLDSARLWNGLTVEAALLELQAGRRRVELRAVLSQFLALPIDADATSS